MTSITFFSLSLAKELHFDILYTYVRKILNFDTLKGSKSPQMTPTPNYRNKKYFRALERQFELFSVAIEHFCD